MDVLLQLEIYDIAKKEKSLHEASNGLKTM